MRMNNQTKLVFALEHVAHLHDLIEDNECEHYLNDAQAKKRLKETEDRIKERMIQFTKDHDNQMSGKQPI